MRAIVALAISPILHFARWLVGRLSPARRAPSHASASSSKGDAFPAIFHVTHWKAGSQWIYKILIGCAPERIVAPEIDAVQLLRQPVRQGRIYPTVYVTREEFGRASLPARWRRFVVIRDLRDTLISYYFSLKVSHAVIDPAITEERAVLNSMGHEEGLEYVMERWLPLCSRIQESWLAAGEPLIRYEQLLEDDLGILERVLLDECELPVARDRFREVVRANRFERLTGGRQRGQEDVTSHERKGASGDWRNHFTDRIVHEFKARYGRLLIATGYEKDLGW